MFLLGIKEFHGLHDGLKIIGKTCRYTVQKILPPKKRRHCECHTEPRVGTYANRNPTPNFLFFEISLGNFYSPFLGFRLVKMF